MSTNGAERANSSKKLRMVVSQETHKRTHDSFDQEMAKAPQVVDLGTALRVETPVVIVRANQYDTLMKAYAELQQSRQENEELSKQNHDQRSQLAALKQQDALHVAQLDEKNKQCQSLQDNLQAQTDQTDKLTKRLKTALDTLKECEDEKQQQIQSLETELTSVKRDLVVKSAMIAQIGRFIGLPSNESPTTNNNSNRIIEDKSSSSSNKYQ